VVEVRCSGMEEEGISLVVMGMVEEETCNSTVEGETF
jgi:hypothetical protein